MIYSGRERYHGDIVAKSPSRVMWLAMRIASLERLTCCRRYTLLDSLISSSKPSNGACFRTKANDALERVTSDLCKNAVKAAESLSPSLMCIPTAFPSTSTSVDGKKHSTEVNVSRCRGYQPNQTQGALPTKLELLRVCTPCPQHLP